MKCVLCPVIFRIQKLVKTEIGAHYSLLSTTVSICPITQIHKSALYKPHVLNGYLFKYLSGCQKVVFCVPLLPKFSYHEEMITHSSL